MNDTVPTLPVSEIWPQVPASTSRETRREGHCKRTLRPNSVVSLLVPTFPVVVALIFESRVAEFGSVHGVGTGQVVASVDLV